MDTEPPKLENSHPSKTPQRWMYPFSRARIRLQNLSQWLRGIKAAPKKNSLWNQIRYLFTSLTSTERYMTGLLAIILFASLLALGVQYYLNNTTVVAARGGEYQKTLNPPPPLL